MSISTTGAGTYLAKHLKTAVWTALSSDQKTAVLAMATDDICCQLNIIAIDETRDNQLNAVYEQAVYLAENFDKINQAQEIQAESIDGAGSRTYKKSADAIAPRARMFINREIGGVFRIGRG
jgi:hypothetical protein